MRFFGLPERTPIGIDIGGRNAKAVQMSHGPGGWRVEAVAAIPRTTIDGQLTRAELRRLAEVMRRRSFTGNQVVLAVPGDKQITGTMELPSRNAGISLDAVARTEFSRAYKCEANTFEMTYWDLPAPARAARTTNVMAVACPHADADALIDLFAAEGLDVVGLDARPWAMARACYPAVEDASGIVLLMEIGWNGSLLVILHGGIVIYERLFTDAGLRTLHAELESEAKIDADVADFVLTHGGVQLMEQAATKDAVSVPAELHAEVRAIASNHFEKMARELLESVSYTRHQYPDATISRLLLLGGGAMIPGLSEQLEAIIGFECRVVTPLASATCSASVARECNAALTTAAGLAQFEDN